MGTATVIFERALACLLASDIDAYAALFTPDATLEWPFAPKEWEARRLEGRERIRTVVGQNLERARAAGRRLASLHDVVTHETADGREVIAEFSVEVRGDDGSATCLPYVHVYRTTADGQIESLRDYFSAATGSARAAALTADDRLAIHELLSLHGHLADDRRTDFDALFTADIEYDIEAYGLGVVRGLDALAKIFTARPGNQPIGHHVTNVMIEQANGAVRVRSKGLSVMADGTAGTVIYDDEVRKTANGWRLARRRVIPAA